MYNCNTKRTQRSFLTMKITQKKLFKTQVLDFDDSKLHITTSKLGNKNEFDISFESIFPEKYDIKESSLILFFWRSFFLSTFIRFILLEVYPA